MLELGKISWVEKNPKIGSIDVLIKPVSNVNYFEGLELLTIPSFAWEMGMAQKTILKEGKYEFI